MSRVISAGLSRVAAALPALAFLLLSGCAPEKGIEWSGETAGALQARSRLEGRPLLVLICPEGGRNGACARLLEEASRPDTAAMLGQTLPLLLESSQPEAVRFMRLHSVQSLPTFLLFAPGGELLVRRDGADSFIVLQPQPGVPMPLDKVAEGRLAELRARLSAMKQQRSAPPDTEAALRMARRAAEGGDPERAAEILGRIPLRELNASLLVNAAETAEAAQRHDMAANYWMLFLSDYPTVGARPEALMRLTRSMIRSGQEDRLEEYVFARRSLNNQWEYLSVASAASSEARNDLARRVAVQGLQRFPSGPNEEALRFYLKEPDTGEEPE
jgi:hypothetical protein